MGSISRPPECLRLSGVNRPALMVGLNHLLVHFNEGGGDFELVTRKKMGSETPARTGPRFAFESTQRREDLRWSRMKMFSWGYGTMRHRLPRNGRGSGGRSRFASAV